MQSNIRIIELLRFLYQQTDEAHAVTVSEMIEYLKSKGIPSVRQTVYTDLEALDTAGIDIVQIKSTQNRYFIGSRIFEYPKPNAGRCNQSCITTPEAVSRSRRVVL